MGVAPKGTQAGSLGVSESWTTTNDQIIGTGPIPDQMTVGGVTRTADVPIGQVNAPFCIQIETGAKA